jgi:hypothetical protein
MRKIEIVDDFRLCFPGQPPEFDLGLELGAISVLMAHGVPSISRVVSPEAVEKLRPIAEHFRYMMTDVLPRSGVTEITLVMRTGRPKLRVV